jgi:hypothetical protein
MEKTEQEQLLYSNVIKQDEGRWTSHLKKFIDRTKCKDYWFNCYLNEISVHDKANSWEEFLAWLQELKGSWCYRGQCKSEWNLCTSLDRALEVKSTFETGYCIRQYDRVAEGNDLLFRFQQAAPQYFQNLPENDDISSWLVLMRVLSARLHDRI